MYVKLISLFYSASRGAGSRALSIKEMKDEKDAVAPFMKMQYYSLDIIKQTFGTNTSIDLDYLRRVYVLLVQRLYRDGKQSGAADVLGAAEAVSLLNLHGSRALVR